MRMRQLLCAAVGLALVATVSGCGGASSKTVKTSGIVTLDGQPLENARVRFIPLDSKEGRQASGTTDSQGRFVLTTVNTGDGALPGEYKVTVDVSASAAGPADPEARKKFGGDDFEGSQPSAEVMRGKMAKGGMQESMRGMAKEQMEGGTGGTKGAEKPSPIPARYRDADKTDLRFAIPHSGDVKIELTK